LCPGSELDGNFLERGRERFQRIAWLVVGAHQDFKHRGAQPGVGHLVDELEAVMAQAVALVDLICFV
jgi:hypothetical protein